jgi:hypothetical protein
MGSSRLGATLCRLFARSQPWGTVSFATTVWEKDWRPILLNRDRLRIQQIENHCFAFAERVLIINNVLELEAVTKIAMQLIDERIFTRFVIVAETVKEVLEFFQLDRSNFTVGKDASLYENVNPDWIYYNALGPLTALYTCNSEYLLYLTGDVTLPKPLDWVKPSLLKMKRESRYKVANPVWNERYKEAKKESIRKEGPFYVAAQGFSDQLFLVRTDDFRQPIYGEIREDAAHFPRGEVFEKRAFSAMKTRGWERLIYHSGSYIHKNF